MRAILRCSTSVEREGLDALLSSQNWWPSVSQDHEIVKSQRSDILSHISDQDRDLAQETLLYTIYDDTTKTWGIVSNPTKHALTFRLKNPVSERLKAACEKLVADLQPLASGRDGARRPALAFVSRVEILEPNSQDHAFSGEILPPKRFWLAVQERKTEAYVGAFAAGLALLLLVATSPPLKRVLLSAATPEWQGWLSGNMERFSTATLVTLAISWFEVALHWFDTRRRSTIRWTLD